MGMTGAGGYPAPATGPRKRPAWVIGGATIV